MKRYILTSMLALVAFCLPFLSSATERIDDKTVYGPNLNICVSSFGGTILSSEIKYFSEAKWRISITKELLLRWIDHSNGSEFYLKQFDKGQFYWQFVETKKYIGAILLVTSDSIHDEFYTSLGAGLNQSGNEFYGLRVPAELNGEIFSFVINKESYKLDYFENWKFAEPADAPLEISSFQSRCLLTNYELAAFTKYSCHRKGLPQTHVENVLPPEAAGVACSLFAQVHPREFVSHLLGSPHTFDELHYVGK